MSMSSSNRSLRIPNSIQNDGKLYEIIEVEEGSAYSHSYDLEWKSRGWGHDALVMDLLTFVGLLKFSIGNSGVMSAS